MGKLVHFHKTGRQQRVRPAVSGNAQIYLFTGVRYERDGTPVPTTKSPTRAARVKRKRV